MLVPTNPDERGMLMAYEAAYASLDLSTQCGAAIRTAHTPREFMGCNYFLRTPAYSHLSRKEYAEFLERNKKLKYACVVHAEANVIGQAADAGVSTHRATLYAPWAACAGCAKTIIASGVAEVVTDRNIMCLAHDAWDDEIALAKEMFRAKGVMFRMIDFPRQMREKIRFRGELW